MDSAEEKQPKQEGEITERSLYIGKVFNFFDTALSAGPKSKFELAHLEGVGTVSGLATMGVQNENPTGRMAILFEVDTPPRKTKANPEDPITGHPSENLWLFANDPQTGKAYVSQGRVEDEENYTRTVFDTWYEKGNITDKADIRRIVREGIGNPLAVEKDTLTAIKFKFSRM